LSEVYDTAVSDGVPRDTRRAEIGVGVLGQAVKFGRPATEVAGEEPSVEVHPEWPLRTLAVPLVVGARVSGAIEFSSPDPRLLSGGSLDVLETLAIHAAASIEAARLHGQAEELGNTDALTGLANRRSLDADLATECQRTARYQRPLALIMFDVDHFKEYNDTFGHQRGDEALQELAATVKAELRTTDSAYRYGGEEFTVLARETSGPQAVVLAERLRSRIQEHFEAHGALAPITASFGVALVPPEQPTPERLVACADAALYAAKAQGRNRVQGGEQRVP
jgi:diguanylate cyclase (GGDEF)-like protein